VIDRRFGMDELGDAFGSEVADALEVGRLLESSIDASTMELPAAATGFDAATEARGEFGDRVMAALADEPAPAAAGFLLPLRRRGYVRGLGASVRQAWVAVGGAGRPALGRVAALAYVLAVAIAGLSLTGAATIGAASALGMLGPSSTQTPSPTLPGPTIAPPAIAPPSAPPTSPSPTVAPSIPAVSPTPSPTETDDHGGGGTELSDDSGGNSGPSGGDGDNSGPGSSSSGSGSGSESGSGSGSDSSAGSSSVSGS
jgi:hypothetical protein